MIVSKQNIPAFYESYKRIGKLEDLYYKTEEAILGQDPQMRKELEKLKKKILAEIHQEREAMENYRSKEIPV